MLRIKHDKTAERAVEYNRRGTKRSYSIGISQFTRDRENIVGFEHDKIPKLCVKNQKSKFTLRDRLSRFHFRLVEWWIGRGLVYSFTRANLFRHCRTRHLTLQT